MPECICKTCGQCPNFQPLDDASGFCVVDGETTSWRESAKDCIHLSKEAPHA
jgi:hypothetical protein